MDADESGDENSTDNVQPDSATNNDDEIVQADVSTTDDREENAEDEEDEDEEDESMETTEKGNVTASDGTGWISSPNFTTEFPEFPSAEYLDSSNLDSSATNDDDDDEIDPEPDDGEAQDDDEIEAKSADDGNGAEEDQPAEAETTKEANVGSTEIDGGDGESTSKTNREDDDVLNEQNEFNTEDEPSVIDESASNICNDDGGELADISQQSNEEATEEVGKEDEAEVPNVEIDQSRPLTIDEGPCSPILPEPTVGKKTATTTTPAQGSTDDDDDDVVVLESHIKPVAAAARRPSQPQLEQPIGTSTPLSNNKEATIPQLLQTVAIRSNESGATTEVGQQNASAAQRATSAAGILKALATGNSSLGGPKPNLPRIAAPGGGLGQRHSAPGQSSSTLTTVTRIITPQNLTRALAPKPIGVVNASIPNMGSNMRNIVPPPPNYTVPGEILLSNGVSPRTISNQPEGIPFYLKAVLNPTSVLPYCSDIPPKEHGLLTPDSGYQCDECGDVFSMKSCLEFHLQRRSMLIEAYCLVCRQPLVFFNKCVFYGHIRQHCGNQRQVSNLIMRNIVVKPISWKVMELAFDDTAFKRMLNIDEFLKYETGRPRLTFDIDDDPGTAMEESSGNDSFHQRPDNKTTAATNNLAATMFRSAMNDDQRRIQVHPTTLSASAGGSQSNVHCSECKMEFASASLLRQHFMYNLPPSQKQLICSSCQAVYFSQCSFKAHTRTHSNQAPLTCPECGSIEASHSALSMHVLTHQKNPTVMDAWRCQKCLTFYSSWDALIMHISATHCDPYYRCEHCQMAFQSSPTFEQHLQTTHGIFGGIKTSDAQLLTKCYSCDVVYATRESLIEHIKSTHCQKLLPFVVYRCALCGRLMENKGGLLGHFRNVHRLNVVHSEVFPVKIQLHGCSTPKRASGGGGAMTEMLKSSPIVCPHCPNMMFNNHASKKLHMKRSHPDPSPTTDYDNAAKKAKVDESMASGGGDSTNKLTCRLCRRDFMNRGALFEDGRRHLRDAINVCLLCQNKDCGLTSILNNHLKGHVESQCDRTGVEAKYRCVGHCIKSFPTAAEALNHLRDLHLMSALHCGMCNTNFYTAEELQHHLRQHATSSHHSSSPIGDGGGINAEDSASSPMSTKIRCNKCGVWIQDIESMHAHAVSHKEPKYFLCLECGLSFAAQTSLGRHLIVAHKISDADKYLRKHPDSNPDKPSELECAVCHAEFSSKPLLDAHVRTHGLLFLKTKARQST